MREYDYKEEANKLKKKRNFGVNFIENEPYTDFCEKELSKKCENLKEYKEDINNILDKLENKSFANEVNLLIDYQYEIQMNGHFGPVWEIYTSLSH